MNGGNYIGAIIELHVCHFSQFSVYNLYWAFHHLKSGPNAKVALQLQIIQPCPSS